MSTRAILSILAVVACLNVRSFADPGGYTGTFVGDAGTITLQVQGAGVTGTAVVGGARARLTGTIQQGRLVGQYELDGSQGQFVAVASADGLEVTIDGAQTVRLARQGGAPTVPGPSRQPAPSTGAVPAPTGAPATGLAITAKLEGWSVRTPRAWVHGNKDGNDFFVSKTEAGIILLRFYAGVTLDQAATAVGQQIAQLGATTLGTRTTSLAAGKALIVELEGTYNGGTVRGRAIGVAGPAGMLVALGVATPDKFGRMRASVDSLAMSARFFKPDRGPVNVVNGCFRRSSGSSHVYVETSFYFDGAGHFRTDGNVSAFTTDTGGKLDGGGASLISKDKTGSYFVHSGNVTLLWDNGSRATYALHFGNGAVDALTSGNRWFLRCR